MPTPGERKAMLFLGAVALLGAGAQAERSRNPAATASAQPALEAQIAAVDSARRGGRKQSGRPRRAHGEPRVRSDPSPTSAERDDATRPTSPGGEALVMGSMSNRTIVTPPNVLNAAVPQLDVDVASATEIERLPRVGPVLAARIVSDRDAHGPFGSLAALGRVSGVGPAMLSVLEARVTFSLTPRQNTTGAAPRARSPRRK